MNADTPKDRVPASKKKGGFFFGKDDPKPQLGSSKKIKEEKQKKIWKMNCVSRPQYIKNIPTLL